MGGKSSSSQSTANNQTTQNIVNDGEFAGVEGNISIDESSQSLDYRSEIDSSNEIDNSIENDGDYAGNHGTITLSDSGAIDAAADIASAALSGNENTLNAAFGFGSDALDEVQTIVSNALENSIEQSESFSDNISSIIESSQSSNANIISNALAANSEDKAVISELAKSTSLAGQDLIAKSSEKMTLYMSVALGLGFIAIIFFGRKK